MNDRGLFILNRYIAKSIDFLIAWGLALILPPVGPLAGLLFLFIADGFNYGQSPGKKLIGLKVIHEHNSHPANFKDSMLRNIPFAITYFFFIIPFLGWLLFIVVGLPILLFESYLVCSAEDGIRVGDIMADTKVVEDRPHKA